MSGNVHRLFARPVQSQDAQFDLWYKHYPRKVSKGIARIAFRQALLKASLEELISGAQRYAIDTACKEQRYVCYPATWLNGERWLDEPARDPLSDRDYARKRAFETRGLWLAEWGIRPDDK